VEGPYALGPVDLPRSKSGIGDKPPAGDGMVCDGTVANCGRNYEGLCLRPRGDPTAPGRGINPLLCTGYALAKADGHLYCLTQMDRDDQPMDTLTVHRDRAIAIDRPGVVADCAYAPDGTLWAGNNTFGLSNVFRIDHEADPAHAQVVSIGSVGVGFPEVIAARGDVLYRMSDTGGSPSLMAKFRCTANGR
jgi:hypothetical protein